MHICVIGAGVVGLTTAYYLQLEGHTVSVVDMAAGPGLGASEANGAQLSYAFVSPLADGSIAPQLPKLLLSRDSPLKMHFRVDPVQWSWGLRFLRHANDADAQQTIAALLPLAELSREFIEPLIEGERIECDFSRGGKLVLYGDAASLQAARVRVGYQSTLGVRQSVLDAEECVAYEPALESYQPRIAGGVWTPTEAAADCGAFCRALAELLERRGAEFHYSRRVTGFDIDGKLVRAVHAPPASLRADAVVLAAGVGAAQLGTAAGLRLPIYPLKGYSITVSPTNGARLPKASITDAARRVVFAPLGRSVRVAGFVEVGDDSPHVPPARTAALLRAAREVLGYHEVDGALRPWAGMRPATPNGRPILGQSPIANLFLNVGHGALGWTLAAGSARLVCDAVAGRAPTIRLTPFVYG